MTDPKKTRKFKRPPPPPPPLPPITRYVTESFGDDLVMRKTPMIKPEKANTPPPPPPTKPPTRQTFDHDTTKKKPGK